MKGNLLFLLKYILLVISYASQQQILVKYCFSRQSLPYFPTSMTSQLSQQENILYQDDTVQIYRDKVTILKYYFPIPAAKNIDMVDIEAVLLKDNVDGQTWGTAPGHMDTWFALDNNRHLKKQYLELVIKDSDVKAAFSPNDPKKVMAIIETNSALLRAEQNLKQELKEVKQQATYTTNMPEKLVQEKIEYKFKQPEQKQQPVLVQQPYVVVETLSPTKTKGIGESIKEKINEKIEGLKNVKDTLKEKYEEGKSKAYVSPDNRIDQAKENINQSWQNAKAKTGQSYKEAGQALEEKGNQMQWQAYQKS